MSRIDEALRRSSIRGADPRGVLAVAVTPPHRAPLEQFPEEMPGGAEAEPLLNTRRAEAAPVTSPGPRTSRQLTVSRPLTGSPTHACRRLATLLTSAQESHGRRTVMVSSAVPDEGHGAVAMDLAVALSHAAPRVLLIDADLHAPSTHAIAGIGHAPGLAESLGAGRHAPSFIALSEHLSVLPAGHVDDIDTDILTSDRMSVLLDHCAAMFHWIVLSAPPVSLLPNAALMARRLGAVAFVIGAHTPFAVAQQAIAQFDRDLLLGTVVRGLDEPTSPEQTSK